MRKLFFVLVLSVFTAMTVSAQESETVTLKLKNGISVTGQIIEKTGEIFKVKTAEGDVFIYRTSEISRIEEQDSLDSEREPKRLKGNRPIYFKKGYRSFIEFSGCGALSDESFMGSRVSLTYVGGYNISPYFYFGLGTGVALTGLNANARTLDIPIYLHIRSAFLKRCKVSPFISLSAGYNISVIEGLIYDYNGYYQGGSNFSSVYIEPTLGAEIRFNQKRAIIIGLTFPIMPSEVTANSDYTLGTAFLGIGGKVAFSF